MEPLVCIGQFDYLILYLLLSSCWLDPRHYYFYSVIGENYLIIVFVLWQYDNFGVILVLHKRFIYIYICTHTYTYTHAYIYTGCNRRNGPNFGRVFLRLNYTDITQNTYIQSSMVTEILAREVWNFDSYYSLVDYQIHIETGRNMWFL